MRFRRSPCCVRHADVADRAICCSGATCSLFVLVSQSNSNWQRLALKKSNQHTDLQSLYEDMASCSGRMHTTEVQHSFLAQHSTVQKTATMYQDHIPRLFIAFRSAEKRRAGHLRSSRCSRSEG